jgi:transposase
VEVLTGTPRRRRWSDAEKAAIVAESMAPGAKSSEIALRHGLHRNQLYDWRRQFRSAAVADAGFVASGFVPVVAENQGGSVASPIEIEIGGATLRVGAGVELGFLGKVLRLLKAMK